jgi:hypothetical protein
MKKISKEQIVCMVASVVFLATCAGYWYTMNLLYGMYASVEELRSTHEALVRNATMQKNTSEEIARIEPLRAEMDSYIVQRDFPTPLLSELEQIERVLGIPIEVRSITHSSTAGGVGEELSLEVSLTFTGAWSEVQGTLRALENISFVTKVHQFVLEDGANKEVTGWSGTVFMRAMVR